MSEPYKKRCGSRMMLSDPTHINYYNHVLQRGTSHWSNPVNVHEWTLTVPRYARYILGHPDKQKNRRITTFGAFEQRELPNAYRQQTLDFQNAKEVQQFEYLENIPTTSVLQAPDVKAAFARIEGSVPVFDPRREQTINELKRNYIRDRTTQNPLKDDMGRILEQGRTRGLEEASRRADREELQRLLTGFRGPGASRGNASFPTHLLNRLANLLGVDTTGRKSDVVNRVNDIISRQRQRGIFGQEIQGESGAAPVEFLQPQERSRA